MSLGVSTAPRAQGAVVIKPENMTIMRVDRDLMKQIKIRAAQEEKTIMAWVDENLRKALKEKKK